MPSVASVLLRLSTISCLRAVLTLPVTVLRSTAELAWGATVLLLATVATV